MTKPLSRDDILGAQDIVTEEVDVPEWGGIVLVRGMTGTQRDAFEASLIQQPTGNRAQRRSKQAETNLVNIRGKLCAWCIVDQAGERAFDDDYAAALGSKSATALSKVFDVAMRLSGMSEADVDEMAEAMIDRPFADSSTA